MKPIEEIIYPKLPNMADLRLGAKVIYASDEFFGRKERLIKPEAPIFVEGKYDDHGKWMDGWETRRKRGEGYDFCIIDLNGEVKAKEIIIDTAHFTGNFPPAASVQGAVIEGAVKSDIENIVQQSERWQELIPASSLQGDSQHNYPIEGEQTLTHIRLNIFPDGGVARLRVLGQRIAPPKKSETIDLLSILNGSRTIATNNQHFGHAYNLTLPGRGENMGDGWETRRRRQPGYDWVIFQLGQVGEVENIEIDTAFFKGNFPHQCSIQAAQVKEGTDQSLVPQSLYWQELLPKQFLKADSIHSFKNEIQKTGAISHIRFNIFPDGGVSRLRLWGSSLIRNAL